MAQIIQTGEFAEWFEALDDVVAQARISARIDAIRDHDHFGNAKRLTPGVSELKIDFGPGYRLYYTMRGPLLVILLCGGNKSTQAKTDVKRAAKIAAALPE